MKTVYCISGLGADENIFQYLDLSFANTVFIKWDTPVAGESLTEYANRLLKKHIPEKNPVILGLSLGGMIGVEIAKSLPGSRVVIISSAKTIHEIPFYWQFLKYLPVYKLLPEWSVKQTSFLRYYFLGAHSLRAKAYLKQVAASADVYFYKWAIGAIVNWKNTAVPANVTHIHGTKDRLLPYRFVQAQASVKNGEHLMIIEHAAEVSAIIKSILNEND